MRYRCFSQCEDRATQLYKASCSRDADVTDLLTAPNADMAHRVPIDLLGPVVAYFEPVRVILFGSRARGHYRADSDFDLLVILDDHAPPEKLTMKAGFEARRPYRHAADVIPCRESVFLQKARIPGTLSHEAALEGVVVYERPPP